MSNDTLRERLDLYVRLKTGVPGWRYLTMSAKVEFVCDLLATNRAQAEEIEKLKAELDARKLVDKSNRPKISGPTSVKDDFQICESCGAIATTFPTRQNGCEYCPNCGSYVTNSSASFAERLFESEDQLATVTQERDARTQKAAQAQARVKELEPLAEFGLSVFEDHRNGGEPRDLDGDWLQEQAERHGLIKTVKITEFCGEGCVCADYCDFPSECLRETPRLEAARIAIAKSSPTAALEAVVQRAREEEREKAATPCIWAEDDDGVWHPACGEEHAFCFNDGGPTENKAKFCHACGHPIEVKPYADEDDRAAGLREGDQE